MENLTHKTYLKPQRAKKISFAILTLMALLLFLPLISAFEFDNRKEIQISKGLAGYNDIEIGNFFGFGKTLWSGTLDSNTNVCGINCESIQTITLHEEGSLVDEVIFKTLQDDGDWKEQGIRSYEILIHTGSEPYEINDYESVCETIKEYSTENDTYYGVTTCEQVLVGSHTEYIDEWQNYELGTELKKGTYEVKLVGQKKPTRTVDWIYETQGEELGEWAIWGGLNLTAIDYYNFDEGSGTTAGDTGTPGGNDMTVNSDAWDSNGMDGSAFKADGNNGIATTINLGTDHGSNEAVTLNLWMNSTAINSGETIFNTHFTASNGRINLQTTIENKLSLLLTDGVEPTNPQIIVPILDDWFMITLAINSSNFFMYYNETLVASGSLTSFVFVEEVLHFAQRSDGTEDLNTANLEGFRVFDSVLNQSDIEFLYNSGNGIFFNGGRSSITLNSPADNEASLLNEIKFNATANVIGTTLVNMSLWHNASGTFELNQTNSTIDPTTNTTTFNATFTEGTYLWGIQGCDSDGDCGFGLNRTIIIDTIAPIITINLPTTLLDFGILTTNETLNWTVIDSNFVSAWFNYNGTNTTLVGAVGETNFTLQLNDYNLTLYANDSAGNINSKFIEWEYKSFINSETFNASTTSGIINPFGLNITTRSGTSVTIARLNYNGSSLGTIVFNGNDYIITKNQIAPGVFLATNFSFFWNITLSDDTNFLTKTKNQTVSPIIINSTCIGMTQMFNFTLNDEIDKTILNQTVFNTSMKVDLNLFTSDRTTKLVDFFKEFNRINPISICIDNNLSNGESYSLDLQIQYNAINHSSEFYNIERFVLNESTLHQNISLFDLDTTNTQNFRLRVKDTSFLPIEGALVQIERKYLENGTFFITEIPKTDANGITSASLQVNDVIYNFKIFDAGTLISTFTNVIAVCQTPLVTQCEIDFDAFQSTITIPDFEEGDDFNFTLEYNDSSRIISSIFVIPSGKPSTVKLVVIREDTLGTAACSDTLTSAAGTLSCTIPSSFGNSTVMAKLFKDDIEQGKGNIKSGQKSADIFPGILIMLSVLVMITLIGMGVSDNPVITAVFLFIGVLVLFAMNLIQNTGFIGSTATILFFAIAVILVIIKASRRS